MRGKRRSKKRTTKPSTTNATTTAVMTTRVQADQEQENDNGSEDAGLVPATGTIPVATPVASSPFPATGLLPLPRLHRDSS